MSNYNALSKRLQDGSIEYTVSYNLKSENDLFCVDSDMETIVLDEADDRYIVHFGMFIVKIPFKYADERIKENGDEFWKEIEKKIIDYILSDYYNLDENFQKYVSDNNYDIDAIKGKLEAADNYVDAFCNSGFGLTDYFDSWTVIKTDDSYNNIEKIIMKPGKDEHTETIKWE